MLEVQYCFNIRTLLLLSPWIPCDLHLWLPILLMGTGLVQYRSLNPFTGKQNLPPSLSRSPSKGVKVLRLTTVGVTRQLGDFMKQKMRKPGSSWVLTSNTQISRGISLLFLFSFAKCLHLHCENSTRAHKTYAQKWD